ncbi:hypothetical protein C2G38_2235764 [Gigaspora rosea]|uniref:FAR1 domain-containing protein n=1 Tax=Gigaspora rosea TaxID=44941 RepID=A0A397TRL2_9GLOM|nr:hypothetical protein C2G38_2235764 [Gigaspora rosea]
MSIQQHFLNINPVIVPISGTLTLDQRRLLLFNVGEPFEIPLQEFDDDWWPLVSNIWTVFSHKNLVNGDSWKTFTCRFAKSSPSSSRKEDVPPEKCRKTKIRPAGLCFAKIKISRYHLKQRVQVERFNNSLDHTHSLEDSEKLKRSQAV